MHPSTIIGKCLHPIFEGARALTPPILSGAVDLAESGVNHIIESVRDTILNLFGLPISK